MREAAPMGAGFFQSTRDGVILHLRVTPNAGRDTIEGVETRDDGAVVLRVRVKAVPDKGKANAAVVALLARSLGVAKSAIALTSGETSRFKTLTISGAPEVLADRLNTIV
jgi:uncharacterized protein (TIGR00251 family)